MSEQLLASSAAESSDLSETYGEKAIPAAPSVGQQLRAMRETKNMSVADVAKALKLSTNQVMALEEDDWSRLPGTIIRGFIRNYARLLNLDAESLMHELTGSQVPPPPTLRPDLPAGSKTTLPEIGQAGRRDYAVVFSGLALFLIALLAFFFLPQDFWQSTLTALTPGGKPTVATQEKPESMPASIPVQPPSLQEGAPANSSAAPEAATAPKQVQQAGANLSNSAPGEGLKLSFAQPSWVEIRDRSGEVIFSQLNPAGSQREIEGQPPFALVIGNATNVTVQYKGRVVDLSQRSKDDVARLNLD